MIAVQKASPILRIGLSINEKNNRPFRRLAIFVSETLFFTKTHNSFSGVMLNLKIEKT